MFHPPSPPLAGAVTGSIHNGEGKDDPRGLINAAKPYRITTGGDNPVMCNLLHQTGSSNFSSRSPFFGDAKAGKWSKFETSFTIYPDKMKWFCDEAAPLLIKYAAPGSHLQQHRKTQGKKGGGEHICSLHYFFAQ